MTNIIDTKWAPARISTTGSGDKVLISAGGQYNVIKVNQLALTVSDLMGTDLDFKDSLGNELAPYFNVTALALEQPESGDYLIQCAPGADLVMNVADDVRVGGLIWYSLISTR